MGTQGIAPRALLVPSAQHGHWIPFLQLIRVLSAKNISFTVCSTAERCNELKIYQANGDFGDLDVEFVVMFTQPNTVDALDMDILNSKEFNAHRGTIVPSKFTCLISDMFICCCQAWADEHGIPTYSFISNPSYFGLVLLHMASLLDEGWVHTNHVTKNQRIDLPGLEMFTVGDLPRALTVYPQKFRDLAVEVRKTAGLLLNTFEEYDSQTLKDLQYQLQVHVPSGKVPPKVFPIGPLVHFADSYPLRSNKSVENESEQQQQSECLEWLDKQKRSSVLYICYGSMKALPKPIITEVAKALESTDIPFLWAVRLPPQDSKDDFLPDGFEERMQPRGLLVKYWVPQKEILVHPAVGGFLSHCGWNSISESIRGGVPVAACPMYAEQAMNARFMVEKVKIAVGVKRVNSLGEFDAEAVAAAIRTIMNREEGEEFRKNMEKMKTAAFAAVTEGGSSYQRFEEFIADISQIQQTSSVKFI